MTPPELPDGRAPGTWLFFESVPCPAWRYDPRTLRVLAANHAAAAAYGFSRDEFCRMTLDELLQGGSERAAFRRQLRRTRPGNASAPQRHLLREGSVLDVTMRWSRGEGDAEGTGPSWSLAWVELGQFPAGAVAPAARADGPLAAFEHAPLAILSLAQGGEILAINAAASALLEWAPDALVGLSFHTLLADDSLRAIAAWDVPVADQPWTGTLRLRQAGGGTVEVEARAAVRAGHRVLVLQDVSDRVRTEGELRRSSDRYRRLSDHSRHVREEERARLSRDLHDRLGQALTGLKMDLAWLLALCDRFEPTTARSAIAVMMDRVDTTIGVVRRIAADLRPGVLDRLGLQAAIEWRAAEFERRSGVRCRVVPTGSLPELDRLQSTEVFRVFEETLTNVSRHAQATRVRITMKGERGKFALHVYDNGRGIPLDAVDSDQSLGLIGMRERATVLGGTVTVSRGRRRGTLVVVRIPVKPRLVAPVAGAGVTPGVAPPPDLGVAEHD